jgi:hypothetical protein
MPAAFTHRRHAKQSHAARPKSWAGSPPTAQSSRQHSSVCFSIEGGPIRGCVNGLILRCGFRFRWGPDRRRWGPHQDDHFRRLISLLDQIWKGSNFGAGSQRTHPVNNRGLTCATPLALANNYTKESPQATKVSEGLARLDADRAEIATQSSGSRREWTRRSRGRIRTAGPFRGNGLVSSAEQEVPESGAILGGTESTIPCPSSGESASRRRGGQRGRALLSAAGGAKAPERRLRRDAEDAVQVWRPQRRGHNVRSDP